MRLIFIRHAESYDNKDDIIQGANDAGLTERGKEQALVLAEKLKDEKPVAIYSSDMKRAIETAEIINNVHNLELLQAGELRERLKGDWAGMRKDEFNKKFPEVLEAWQKDIDVRPPNGESIDDVAKRAIPFILKVVEQYKQGDTIFIVAHGNSIRAILGEFLNIPVNLRYKLGQDYCAISELNRKDDGRFSVRCINR